MNNNLKYKYQNNTKIKLLIMKNCIKMLNNCKLKMQNYHNKI